MFKRIVCIGLLLLASLAGVAQTTHTTASQQGNNAFTGNNTHAGTETFNNALSVSGGGTLTGNFSGNPVFTGNPSFSGSPIFGTFTSGSFIGTAGNQGILVKDINVGSAFTCIGDSITQGFNASDAAHAWCGLVATAKGWAATNDGLASTQLADAAETDSMFAETITSSSINAVLAGHNDMRANFNAAQEGEWQANLYSTMAWLAIPDANKIKGTAAGCVYAGTWITSTIYGGSFAKASTANASTATCTTTIPSSVVYFNYLKQVGNTSTFTLTVDGVSIVDPQSVTGGTTFASLGHITTGSARNYEPQMVRISNLADTVHTVVMTVVSADNSGGNSPYVVWVGSPSASAGTVGPYVFLGNTVRLKTSDYAGFGGSDALVGIFNILSLSVASDLANDGLNVDYVDAASAYNPNDATQYSTASVGNFPFTCTGCPHPTNAGHVNIANAFLFEMSGLHTPRDRMAAMAFHANGFSTAGGALHVGGFCNQQSLGDGCFSRKPDSGGIHFGSNGNGVIFQSNSSSMQFNPGNTGFPIAFDFGTVSSTSYPRLKIPSAGAVQLRNTLDSADLPFEALTFNAGGGALATPAFSFSAEPASGWFRQQAGIMGFGIGGSYLTQFRVDRVGYAPGVCVGWAVGPPNANSDDTTLCRSGVSSLTLGNGAGAGGTFKAATYLTNGDLVQLNVNGIGLASTGIQAWSSTTSSAGTADTTTCRQAAGVIEAGTGTTCNSLGSYKALSYLTNGDVAQVNNAGIALGSAGVFAVSSTASSGGTADTTQCRAAAGVWESGTGTTCNALGTYKATVFLTTADTVQLNATGAGFGNVNLLAWSSTASSSGTADTTECRQAAGVVEIGTGTTCNANGTLKTAVVNLATENISAAPRMTWNGFAPALPGAAVAFARWTNDKAITVTSIEYQATTTATGCSTQPVVTLQDNTTPAAVTTITLVNATAGGSTTGLSVNVAAGKLLSFTETTAPVGCTGSWANINFTIQYKMQ